MADEVSEIKDKLDIVEFINSYVPLKKTGRNFRALCPFHTEKTPSFIVSPERQSWHCFGCGKGGDIYAFLMEKEGLTFGEALRILSQRAGIKLATKFSPQKQARKERLLAASHLASEFYHYLLTKHKVGEKARKYLSDRAIEQESIKEFRLGYAPASWETTGKFLLSRDFKIDELLETGLIIGKEGDRGWYDRFRGRLVFPVFDVLGRVVGFSARTLTNEEPKYINSPDSAIFRKGNLLYGLNLAKDEIRQKGAAILVEGNVDVISSHQEGFKTVVAPLGTGVTEEHGKLIKRFTQEVIFAFDNDEAGEKATLRGLELAQAQGLEILVVRIKEAQDADELIRKDPALFKNAIDAAVPGFDYLLSLGKEKFGVDTVSAKKKIAVLTLPFIARTPDEVSKDALVKRLSEELSISEKAVWQDLTKMQNEKYQISNEREKGKQEPIIVKKPREILLAEHLLHLILTSEKTVWQVEKFQDIIFAMPKDYFALNDLTEIWQTTKDYFGRQQKIDLKKIGAKLSESAQKTYDLLILRPAAKIYEKEAEFLADLELAVLELKKLFSRRQLQELSVSIRAAEKKDARDEVDRLKKEFKETLGKMPKE